MTMTTAKKTNADAAPGTVEVGHEQQQQPQRKDKDRPADEGVVRRVTPPPAPGMAEQEDRARARNPQQSAWLAKPTCSWIYDDDDEGVRVQVAAADDTKAAVLDGMAQAVIARFNADTALAQGRAVTQEWLDGQILTYQLPITEDDARAAVRSAFETAGIDVRG